MIMLSLGPESGPDSICGGLSDFLLVDSKQVNSVEEAEQLSLLQGRN